MVDDHQPAIASVIFRDGNDTVRGGMDRCAIIRRDVNTGMERPLSAERIEPLSKAIGDMS